MCPGGAVGALPVVTAWLRALSPQVVLAASWALQRTWSTSGRCGPLGQGRFCPLTGPPWSPDLGRGVWGACLALLPPEPTCSFQDAERHEAAPDPAPEVSSGPRSTPGCGCRAWAPGPPGTVLGPSGPPHLCTSWSRVLRGPRTPECPVGTSGGWVAGTGGRHRPLPPPAPCTRSRGGHVRGQREFGLFKGCGS